MNEYQHFCKPSLHAALQAMGLNYVYHRAATTYLYYWDEQSGEEKAVLDLLGGYGAVLLQHHHPELVRTAVAAFHEGCPVHSQFSVRTAPAKLAARLNQILRQEAASNEDFLFSFCSTGAEAVEIAVKHAELARSTEVNKQLTEINFRLSELKRLQRQLTIPTEFSQVLNVATSSNASDLASAIEHYNQQILQRKPCFIALKNSFHGKLSGSVQLTHGSGYSGPYRHLGLDVRFCDADEILAFARDFPASSIIAVKQLGDQFSLYWQPVRVVSAIFAEPVQGEGGIRCLTSAQSGQLKQASQLLRCPLVADEIQSGSGRCGSFLAGSQIGLQPDYVILSKALGGGLVKIGLVAIKSSAYVQGYDLVQSSTFGEDEHSATVALRYLELLYQNEGAAFTQINQLGELLLQRLKDLQTLYPDVISEVRGRGFLLGVELTSQHNASSMMFRTMSYQDSLGYMAAGFLLNQHALRVAPSASAPNVIRMEPNLCLTPQHIESVYQAFADLCQTLRYQDSYYFLRFLTRNLKVRSNRSQLQDFRQQAPVEPALPPAAVRVAFINHLISADWLAQIDPSMQQVPVEEADLLLNRLDFDWRVAPLPAQRFVSATGVELDFVMYPLGLTSNRIARMLADNDLGRLRDAIDERIQTAQQDGCQVAGLGMFTSVVTNNAKSVRATNIALTTGNSLTVAMSVEAVLQAMAEQPQQLWRAAVIGAAGNIGRIYATALSTHCRQLLLIGSGRAGSDKRLQQSVCQIYQHCWQQLVDAVPATGICQQLVQHPTIAQWLAQPELAPAQAGQAIFELMADEAKAPLLLSDDIRLVQGCEVVVCATNAADAFLPVELLRHGTVICDVSVPHNLDEQALAGRPDLVCIRGGIVATPHGESLPENVRAYLQPGQIYACMAETIVLGMENHFHHYSYGDLDIRNVAEIHRLAAHHGFGLAQAKTSQSM